MLAISEEFLSFQGEGMQAGTRMYFIRLQGCAVGCYFCDTKYSWKETDKITNEDDIATRAKASGARWACITGGEPLEQDIGLLVNALKAEGMKIALETSGMYQSPHLKHIDWIVVSPKNLFAKEGMEINRTTLIVMDELKCVVTKPDDVDYYINFFRPFEAMKVFQPVDNDPKIAKMLLERKDIEEWKVKCQEQKVFQVR